MQVVNTQTELDNLLDMTEFDGDTGTYAILNSFSLISLYDAKRTNGNKVYIVSIYDNVSLHTPFDALCESNFTNMHHVMSVIFDTVKDAASFYTHRITQGINEAFTQ